MKLEVGMYVRTEKGLLGKLLSKEKDGCGFILKYEGQYNKKVWSSSGTDSEIIKASFNIIDLIKVGDYVNGSRVVNKYTNNSVVIEKEESIHEDDGTVWSDCIEVNVKDIKSIVTKEQFKANEYKV